MGSFVFVGIGFYWLILPEWRSWSENSQMLQQYRLEADELPILRTTLKNLQKKQESVAQDFDVVRGFVSEESIELFTTKFFSETARRSNVRLLGVNTMRVGEPFTCIQLDQADLSLDDSLPPEPSSTPDQLENENVASPAALLSPEAAFTSDLSGIFKVNRFEISVRGNYLNMMDYLRYLNQYQQSISPLCLEVFSIPIPPASGDPSGPDENPEPRYVGEVNAKLIVDVPQREISQSVDPDSQG